MLHPCQLSHDRNLKLMIILLNVTFVVCTPEKNFNYQQSLVCLTDLQNVNITLRILFRPQPHILPQMYMNLGEDYDERVLPSITTEVLKAVVVSRHHSLSSNATLVN